MYGINYPLTKCINLIIDKSTKLFNRFLILIQFVNCIYLYTYFNAFLEGKIIGSPTPRYYLIYYLDTIFYISNT
jgi:hypothetical protein